jgi:predicted Zn-dependent peptidase
VRVTTLANGLRVVSHAMASVETISTGVWVGAGTRFEHAAINGVSHVLEHMAFKGTERRGARAIAEEIEAVGGHLNAYTSRESTAYYAKMLKEDLGLAIDIIADILQNSVMDEEELGRERSVIIQEISQAQDTPDDVVFDNFQITAFPDQPIGQPVLGTAELVGNMSRKTILDYMKSLYRAPNMVLAAAGNLDHDRLVELVQAAFRNLAGGEQKDSAAAEYAGGESREERATEQVHLVLGFEAVPYDSPDYYPLSVFSSLFGGGMSSRLFQEVREKHGLVYSIYSFGSCYSDSGLFGIYAGTGESEAAKVLPMICDEIKKTAAVVGDDEIRRARAQLKSGILMSLESTSSRCEQLARQMMVFGRPLPSAEVIDHIEAVTAESIRAATEKLFAGPPTLAALGPIGSVESLEKIKSRLN